MAIAQQLQQKGIENGIDHNTVMKMTELTEDDQAQIRHYEGSSRRQV